MRTLVLWIGLNPMPQWRSDCVDTLKHFHPELKIDFVWEQRDSKTPEYDSDYARVKYCAEGKNRLWVDSDIEILAPLPLGEEPMMADETGTHHSICWSGSNPQLFARGYSLTRLCNRIPKTVKPDGIYRHWQTGPNGERVPRTNLGYKSEDFI